MFCTLIPRTRDPKSFHNIERFSSGPAAWTSRNAGPRWRFAVLDEAVGGPKGYGYYELLMPLKAVGGPRSWGP